MSSCGVGRVCTLFAPSVGSLRAEAARDPRTVSIVERDELARDDSRGLVHLFSGGGRVFVHQQPSQLAQPLQPLQPSGAFQSDDAYPCECIEVKPRVGVLAPGTDLGELESLGCEFGDVVVELVYAPLDGLTLLSSRGS